MIMTETQTIFIFRIFLFVLLVGVWIFIMIMAIKQDHELLENTKEEQKDAWKELQFVVYADTDLSRVNPKIDIGKDN
jgi:regulatory protein YycI of two-component signal transduction system YycFG